MLPAALLRNVRRTLGGLLFVGGSLQAQTYGNSLEIRPNRDAFGQFISVVSTPFQPGSVGGTLSSFGLFGGTSSGQGGSNVGGAITPLLARLTGGVWSVVGVGTTRTIAAGLNSWDFGLTSGSATIAADLQFGWWAPSGAVLYTLGGTQTFFTDNSAVPFSPTAAQNFTTPLSDQRTYSIQWTVVPSTTVPEPSTYVLMAAGLGMLAFARRARKTR